MPRPRKKKPGTKGGGESFKVPARMLQGLAAAIAVAGILWKLWQVQQKMAEAVCVVLHDILCLETK
jgi:hypothetical protein